MSKDVLEGNKSIAKFMGYSKIEDTSNLTCDVKELWIENKQAEPDKRIIQGLPKYHSSWDWLMPVCKKCYDLWVLNHKEDKECSAIFENLWAGLWRFNIDEVWEEVIEFIKWYNTQPLY